MERRVIATVLLMFGLTALALVFHFNQFSLLEEIATLLFDVGKTPLP